ncbi:hypothetical protein BD626DRAFT_569195 [Schizophyllum amplum]|uniref:Protein kinase domain-containing protein n=1 Tax=Schizophyllum amplum TaxID=97359 RepID=A0A550CEC4_9AGAR|nr:hypothetical protein BD626DRAFT_569195 [Auriculariopsis ampla]
MSDATTRPFVAGNPSSIMEYWKRMAAFDKASNHSPLREGSTFDLALVEPPPLDRAGARDAPCFPFSTQATFVLCRPLQQGDNYYSQVWVARQISRGSDVEGAELVLKFIIPSQLDLPSEELTEEHIMWASYFYPEDIVAYQAAAYNALAKQQGCTVPYFYGAHKVTAPWGELVSVLALEYISAPCLWEIRDALGLNYPDDDAPHIPAFMEYLNYEKYFALFQSAIETITNAHAVNIRHRDIRDAHILVDLAHNRVVLIDWTNDAPAHLAKTGLMNDPGLARIHDVLGICRRFLRCKAHYKRLLLYIYPTFPMLHNFVPRP